MGYPGRPARYAIAQFPADPVTARLCTQFGEHVAGDGVTLHTVRVDRFGMSERHHRVIVAASQSDQGATVVRPVGRPAGPVWMLIRVETFGEGDDPLMVADLQQRPHPPEPYLRGIEPEPVGVALSAELRQLTCMVQCRLNVGGAGVCGGHQQATADRSGLPSPRRGVFVFSVWHSARADVPAGSGQVAPAGIPVRSLELHSCQGCSGRRKSIGVRTLANTITGTPVIAISCSRVSHAVP
jgi:hypothetical protein